MDSKARARPPKLAPICVGKPRSSLINGEGCVTPLMPGFHEKQVDEKFRKKVAEDGWRDNDAHQDLMKKAIEAYVDKSAMAD
uniref:Uncharacterized protein n=1 Tax=Candidatus Kentrum sp. SD TaxID=2126332 RepID=A0A450Y4A5_9GAMM|nr:MAG: hypothetical protein BECKSD772F_GA0070984_100146 [Candidatus Kentron sp. SD]VFK38587.1 MAG: hypothetical protein BECKSD772E_GA0070983_100145 [Candidatus Kentron sp. SD]